MRSILGEIIRKECEGYRLIDQGWLRNVEEGVDIVYTLASAVRPEELADKERFLSWRRNLLLCFYQSIGFTDRFRAEKGSLVFHTFLFELKKKMLRIYRERYNGKTIDNDLAVPPHTVAFLLSPLLSKEQYKEEESVLDTIQMPAEIEQYYQRRCADCFPLDLPGFLLRIKGEDREFVNELLRLIRILVGKMMSYLGVSIQYKKEVLQDAWSSAYEFVGGKIKDGTLPVIESSLHLRYYIGNVCKNKVFDSKRNNKVSEMVGIGDELWDLLSDTLPQKPTSRIDFNDIDTENEDEVRRALAIILLDREEPWYGYLTEGLEDKMALLLAHYIDGKPYDEIARKEAGRLSGKDKIRMENNLRKIVSRTCSKLHARYMELLINKQNS